MTSLALSLPASLASMSSSSDSSPSSSPSSSPRWRCALRPVFAELTSYSSLTTTSLRSFFRRSSRASSRQRPANRVSLARQSPTRTLWSF
eukprot:6213347-Pleurochrysis_carterae.AAC.1